MKSFVGWGRWLFFFCAVLALVETKARAQSTLLSVTTRRDFTFDSGGQFLYITTSTGLVQPYNLSTGLFATAFNLGGSLNGLDIARDDSFLLIAQNNTAVSQGTFHRLDLATGTVTNINYSRASGETGAWDVVIGANGFAFVTTQFGGSGWTPLRQIDLATNAISARSDAPGSGGNGQVRQNTQLHRSADGSRFYLLEANISSGPVFTYSATNNTFGPVAQTNTFLDFASAAVSRDGSLLATRTFNQNASIDTAPAFNFVRSFSGIDSGVAFDAVTDTFYGVNSATDQIIAYDPNTGAEKFRLHIAEDVSSSSSQFGNGALVASADGRYLALATPGGIRLFAIPEPGPATLVLLIAAAALGRRFLKRR